MEELKNLWQLLNQIGAEIEPSEFEKEEPEEEIIYEWEELSGGNENVSKDFLSGRL